MTVLTPAPPYRGEGPHALWHVSETPSIPVFRPRRAPTTSEREPLVWAVDTRHLPLFWFPRQCPRATFWAADRTTDAHVERFLAGDRARRVHAIERGWRDRVRDGRLFAHRLPPSRFRRHANVAGYWVSGETVEPLEVVELPDLLGRHARAAIELRVLANLWPLWDAVVGSTLAFSGIRLRNALPRPTDGFAGPGES